MMERVRPGPARRKLLLALPILIVLILPPLATATTAGGAPSLSAAASPAIPLPGINAIVRWGGVSIATATSVDNALATTFAHPIDVNFTWVSRGGAGSSFLDNVSVAEIQFFFFGAALDTQKTVASEPVAASNGSFDLTWQPGLFPYLFAGSFRLAATLLAPNGTTMWDQSFFIHASAPFYVGAALPALLVIIAIYEAYGLATAGRADAPPSARPARGPEKPQKDAEAPEEASAAGEGGPE